MSESGVFFLAAMIITAIISGLTVHKAIEYGRDYEARRSLHD